MTKEVHIEKGKDEFAVVRRIVPGKLVYVETKPDKTYAFKLDKVVIRKPDGSCSPYRGEPLSELGLDVGKRVVVWRYKTETPALVVDADANISSTNISSTLGNTFSRAVDYFKR